MKKISLFLWKVIYRTCAIFLTFVILSSLFLFWRLSTKPLDLEFLMPEIQKYIFSDETPFKLEADSIVLSAKMKRSGLFHVNIQNMSLLGKDDVLILDLPSVELSYGFTSLLTLNYLPKSLRIDEALLQLTLTKNEQLLLQGQTSDTIDDATASDVIDTLITSDATETAGPLAGEKAVVVRDIRRFAGFILKFRRLVLNKASVIIDDEKTGRRIIVPQLNFALKRQRFKKYKIEVDTAIRIQRDLMTFKGEALYNSLAQTIEFDAFFNQVNLSRAGRVIPLLDGLRVLLRGEINGSLDIAEGAVHWRNAFKALSFTVSTIKPGEVQLPAPLDTVYPVKNLTAIGNFSKNLETLVIRPAKASLTTGLTADVELLVNNIGDFLDTNNFNLVKTTLNARIKNIPMNEVPAVWPSYLGSDAHEWVKRNLKTGVATNALFALYFTGGELSDLLGDIDFKNTTVDYLSPMRPIENAGGKVMFYPDKVEVFADRGSIGNIKLKTGNVYLTDLQAERGQAKIELDVMGPTPEILALIDEKPLLLLSGYGILPSQTGGMTSGQVTLLFPLSESISVHDVNVDISASVSNGLFQTADGKDTIKEVNADLKLNSTNMTVQGRGMYNQTPLEIKWEEFFLPSDKNPVSSIYTVKGSINDSFIKPYIKDVSDYLLGVLKGEVVYKKQKNKTARVHVNADLTESEIMVYPLSYTKVKGVPSRLTGEFSLSAKNELTKARFEVEADKKAFDVVCLYEKFPEKTSIKFEKVSAPGTFFSLQTTVGKKDDLSIKLKGKSWLMTELKNMPYFKQQAAKPSSAPSEHVVMNHIQTPPPAIDLDISMDSITLNPKAPLRNVAVKARRSGFTWKNLFVFAQGTDAFSINLAPETNKIDGLVNDLGDMLKRFNFSEEFEHGKATLSAYQNNTGMITGDIYIRNLDFKNPGFIMQALTILGIVDAVRGKELNFSTGLIPFELSPWLNVKINDGVLYGTSLGVTFTGTGSTKAIKMSGSVIPAYAVNSLPGRIPVIGGLFRSAPNGGLMGVKYDLTGTPSASVVTFNPLSSIAPGILSKLFQ